MSWWKLWRKRQKKYEEELAHRRAIELKEERDRKEEKNLSREEREEDIKVVREYAEAGITGAAGKARKLKWLFSRGRRKKEVLEALVEERERAEDSIADREPRPKTPQAEAELANKPESALRLGMKG